MKNFYRPRKIHDANRSMNSWFTQRHAVVLRQAYKQSAIAIFTDKNGPRDTLAVGMRASFIETAKDVTRVGFEPTPPRGQRPERCALDRSAIVSVLHAYGRHFRVLNTCLSCAFES